MRASDADRERVAEHLRDAVAEGRLDMEEFQERLEATYRARTYGELAPITRDLPAAGGGGALAAPGSATGPAAVSMGKGGAAPAGSHWPARVGGAPTSSGAFAFWGGFARRGRWTIARTFTAFAMWGGGEIDLREASFEDRETVIRCFTIMGGMQVTVPPDLNVQVSGVGVMGGFGDHGAEADGDPAAPRVKVTGFALMGGVGVERKATRAEKQRLKEERRRLQEERHRERQEHREGRRDEAGELRRQHRHELEGRRERHREHRRDVREARSGRRGERRGRYDR
ncbi:DUF1707 SHOCT-like domain-containing protein [Streptomyces sulfonofaciens]|uniref:DUF1707 SHOCT-like domain-containing protein n=1 Tax=Streptomyces sulfonofaciens TaxID=68272 RepID=UPI001E48013A|nr:DUF1707 domain-containing protein [Streptomyces sulfonofaciens]